MRTPRICRKRGSETLIRASCKSAVLPIPDLLVQASGRRRRLDAQLLGQQPAADVVLDQGLAAPAGKGQAAHCLQVGFLQPRVQLQLAPDIMQRLLDLPACRVGSASWCIVSRVSRWRRSRWSTIHSSNAGQSASEKPSRNGPRYRSTACLNRSSSPPTNLPVSPNSTNLPNSSTSTQWSLFLLN